MSTSGSPRSAPPSARTYWRTSRAMRWCSTARMTSPVFRISCARRRARRPRSAGLPASTPSPFRAWIVCGDGAGATDNKAIIAEMVALRAERARLLGYPSFADYRLDDTMAKTPEAVRALLERVWKPARSRALIDRDAMQAIIREEGGNFELAP